MRCSVRRQLLQVVVGLYLASAMAEPHHGGDSVVITNFWESNRRSHAGGHEAARAAFRTALVQSQNPPASTCGRERQLCTCQHRVSGSGLFSQLHGRMQCLLQAFVKNCTLVDDRARNHEDQLFEAHLYFGCDVHDLESPWECYFAPLSTCTAADASKTRSSVLDLRGTEHCAEFKRYASRVGNLFGLRSPLLLRSEVLSYLMRPTELLTNSVLHWADVMQLHTIDDFDKCLAVHIRHSDKAGVPKSEKHHTKFVGAADDVRWLYGLDVINYMTDDPKVDAVFKNMPTLRPRLRVTTIPAPASRKVDTRGDTTDIGLMLITHAMLLAQCTVLLGSQISNVDRAILELMATVHWPPANVDMYGDLYLPCASQESHTNFTKDSEEFFDFR